MTLKMTERDKKLLVFLAAFVLIFGVGFFVIMPLIRSNGELKERLESAKYEQSSRQQKTVLADSYEETLARTREEIAGDQGIFYEKMPGSGVDQLMTEMALGFGLVVNELEISMPADDEYTELQSYLGLEEQEDAQNAEGEKDDGIYEGVYDAQVRMSMSGSREDLQAMLDACAQMQPKMLVREFSWQDADAGMSRMSMYLEIFMYQDMDAYLEAVRSQE